MSERHCDLMRQGFMKPAKRRNNTRTDAERADELSAMLGERVGLSNQRGRYAVPMPGGYDNHLTYADAKRVIKLMQKEG